MRDRWITMLAALVVLTWIAFGAVAAAHAIPIGPDPHIPLPGLRWCPGGGTFTPLGGYCDGVRFPDGSYWHQVGVGGFWKMSCNIEDGTAFPPVAPPTGCGAGSWSTPYPESYPGSGGLGTVA